MIKNRTKLSVSFTENRNDLQSPKYQWGTIFHAIELPENLCSNRDLSISIRLKKSYIKYVRRDTSNQNFFSTVSRCYQRILTKVRNRYVKTIRNSRIIFDEYHFFVCKDIVDSYKDISIHSKSIYIVARIARFIIKRRT